MAKALVTSVYRCRSIVDAAYLRLQLDDELGRFLQPYSTYFRKICYACNNAFGQAKEMLKFNNNFVCNVYQCLVV